MERRWPQEIHLHVVWRQVIAGGQPGLVELHGPVGGGEQPAAKPDFYMSGGWDDVDRVAWRHHATGYRWVPAPGGAHSRRSGAPRQSADSVPHSPAQVKTARVDS